MKNNATHIPFLEKIEDFFKIYGLGKPLHSEVMCMRLEDQTDEKLIHMPLYRSNFFRIIHFENADLHFRASEKEVVFSKNCMAFSFPSKLESWTRVGRLYGTVVYFTADFLDMDITHKNFDAEYPYFNFDSEPALSLTPDDIEDLKYWEQSILREMLKDTPDKLDFLKKLLHIYLHKIRRIYNRQTHCLSEDAKTNRVIFNRFRQVLDDSMQGLSTNANKMTPSVSDLAQKMHLTPKHLNDIIKDLTGKTASSFIQDKLILEAKSYLIHTSLQVAEIANCLGFDTPQYFNRFFKKHLNMTPLNFREAFSLK